MKIILTGTYNSGKTTVVTKYANNKYVNIMGELVRSLALEPNFYFKSDKLTNYAFSEVALAHILYGMAKVQYLLDNKKIWIYDRCIIDILYYFRYFQIDRKLREINKANDLYKQVLTLVNNLLDTGYFKDAVFLLLSPIKLILEDDFRMIGNKDQIGIYNIAKSVLEEFKLPFYQFSAREAVDFIEDKINNYKTNQQCC